MAFLTVSAWGGTIPDPQAAVEADNFSVGITTFNTTFLPTDNNGILALFNDTGYIISSLTLHTTINKELNESDISSSFSCNGASDPFFLNCQFGYNPRTGDLTISFFGVNSPGTGTQEGIPLVAGDCSPTGPPCKGHFAFVFNDNFSMSPDSGNGWNGSASSVADPHTVLFDTTPTFDPPQFTTPEPWSPALLGGGILALGALRRRKVRS